MDHFAIGCSSKNESHCGWKIERKKLSNGCWVSFEIFQYLVIQVMELLFTEPKLNQNSRNKHFLSTLVFLTVHPPIMYKVLSTLEFWFLKERSQFANSPTHFFFGRPVFRFSTFFKSNNSWFKKEKMWFLKSRFACTTKNVYYDKKSILRTSKKSTELNNFKSLEFSAF